ncbi:hypothetical protein BaRGS_00014035 [Batillaria attramentaria]|uniref:Uncharacterized protein n=1 Tax=Batillaria attramentaria TaxID=370345 RepID=A0ABD0L678_9CAEN
MRYSFSSIYADLHSSSSSSYLLCLGQFPRQIYKLRVKLSSASLGRRLLLIALTRSCQTELFSRPSNQTRPCNLCEDSVKESGPTSPHKPCQTNPAMAKKRR